MISHEEFEEYLGQSEEVKLSVYELLMRTAPAGVWYSNGNGELIYISSGAVTVLGRGFDEIKGKAYFDYVHPDDKAKFRASIRHSLDQHIELDSVFRYRTSDARWIWVRMRAVWSEKHNGFPAGLVGIVLDVTNEQRQTHEAQMLRHCVEQVKQPIVVTDATGDDNPIIYTNAAFAELTGYTRKEVTGRNPRILHGVDVDQPELAYIRKLIDEGKPVDGIVVRNYTKTGKQYLTELYISPVYHHDLLTYWVGVQVVVTEKVRAKEINDLREVIQQLSKITADCR